MVIRAPVFVIGCARSGTTLLYNILSEAPSLWSTGYESKAILEKYHHPSKKDWVSGALDASDLTPESRKGIEAEFARRAAPGTFWRRVNRGRSWLRRTGVWRRIKRHGGEDQPGSGVSSALPQQGLELVMGLVRLRNRLPLFRKPATIRLLEKTPENCLRLPFLLALFPDARVIYLIREGRANINSLIEGWRHPHLFTSYHLPGVPTVSDLGRDGWAFTLIPGWQELVSSPVEEICAWQWIRCNEAVLDFKEGPGQDVPLLRVRYEDLVEQPEPTLARVFSFAGIEAEMDLRRYDRALPVVNTVSEPDPEKWRSQNLEAIQRITSLIQPLSERLGYQDPGEGATRSVQTP